MLFLIILGCNEKKEVVIIKSKIENFLLSYPKVKINLIDLNYSSDTLYINFYTNHIEYENISYLRILYMRMFYEIGELYTEGILVFNLNLLKIEENQLMTKSLSFDSESIKNSIKYIYYNPYLNTISSYILQNIDIVKLLFNDALLGAILERIRNGELLNEENFDYEQDIDIIQVVSSMSNYCVRNNDNSNHYNFLKTLLYISDKIKKRENDINLNGILISKELRYMLSYCDTLRRNNL